MQTKLHIRRFTFTLLLGIIINNCFSKTLIDSLAQDDLLPTVVDTSQNPVYTDLFNPLDTTSLPLSKNGPETKVKYTAKDSIELDNAKQIVHLYGEATVTYGSMNISADRITIYLKKNQVDAFGKQDSVGKIVEKVRFEDGDEFFLAPQMNYNFKTKKGKIKRIYTQEGDLHLHAKQAKKMPDNSIFVKNGKITTCNHEDPHFYFSASKLKVIPQKVMVAGPTHLVIRDFHTPIWVPFGIFPNNKEKQSGVIIPSQGSLNSETGISELGYHWAINDFVHLEFLSSLYFGGSYQLSGDARYIKKYKYKGNFGLKHNRTKTGIKGLIGSGDLKDYNLIWNHSQDAKAHPKSSFSAQVTAKTGSYNQTQLITNQNINTAVQSANSSQIKWNWREKWGGLTVLSRFDQNLTTETIKLTAPSMNFNVTNQKLLGNLNVSGNVSLENSISAADSVFAKDWKNLMRNGMRASTTFNIGQSYSIPLPVLKYLKFSLPSLTLNGYLNSKSITKQVKSDTVQTSVVKKEKLSYDLSFGGFGVNTKIYGMYKLKEGMFLSAFRHTITPSISMGYTPDFYIDAQDINRSYSDPESGKEVTYSIYDDRNYSLYSPSATERWTMSYALDNRLEAKVRSKRDSVASYKPIDLISSLYLRGSHNFLAKEKDNDFKWSDLSLGINANPGLIDNLNVTATISPYALDSAGSKIHTLMWDSLRQVGRLTRLSVTPTINLKRALFYGKEKEQNSSFDWSMNINYTFSYSKPSNDAPVLTNVLSLSGKVDLTQNWSFSYNAPVRILQRDFHPESTVITITRKLHCWEMVLMWRPFSEQDKAQYSFAIRPQSGILADLKYEKKISQQSLF